MDDLRIFPCPVIRSVNVHKQKLLPLSLPWKQNQAAGVSHPEPFLMNIQDDFVCELAAFFKHGKEIIAIGFSSFICSLEVGFMIVLFNNQIMRWLGSDELAVYGVASNLFTLVQTFSYGIGNGAQPIVAENLGARQWGRIRETRNLGCITAAVIGGAAVSVSLLFPSKIIGFFMNPSNEAAAAAPSILRKYFLCLLFVPFNVFATYYLQSVKQIKKSVTLSILRCFLLSGLFVSIFPVIFGADSIWFVMVSAECITAVTAVFLITRKIFSA